MRHQPSDRLHRLYLSPYETTPTYRNVHNKFSVSYLLNLVLVDEEDRRYFKQQEIVLYRLADSAQVRLLSYICSCVIISRVMVWASRWEE